MTSSNKENHALRFSDLIKGSQRMLPPIKGYETVPLVSLEEAVEPLVSIVFDVRRMVWIVKENSKEPADHLSPNESASIMLYSMEWTPRENSFYMKLNNTLRAEDRHALKPWFAYLKLFITALDKLPSEHRPLYRGIKEDLHENYTRGKTFVWWGFTSCTCSLETLENELFLGKSGQRTLFNIKSSGGKNIRQHSMFKKEDEVVLLVARQFRVESCLNVGNGLWIIDIVEIEPLYPLVEPLSTSVQPKMILPIQSISIQNKNLDRIIRQSPTAGCIDLSGETLNEQDMQLLVRQGLKEKQCKILDLMHSEITSGALSLLADALRDNHSLDELNLSHSHINDDKIRLFTSTINDSILKHLDLTENEITDQGTKYLAEVLEKNTNLLRLSLARNQIGDQGVKFIAQALRNSQTKIEVLNLSGNTRLTDDCIGALIEMLDGNHSLKKLDLRHCQIGENEERNLQSIVKTRKGFQLWMTRRS